MSLDKKLEALSEGLDAKFIKDIQDAEKDLKKLAGLSKGSSSGDYKTTMKLITKLSKDLNKTLESHEKLWRALGATRDGNIDLHHVREGLASLILYLTTSSRMAKLGARTLTTY